MKTFLRIILVLLVLFLVLVGTGLFVLTRPGVQKRLVESQLPEGSSIREVRVTTSSLKLSELKLALPDGTEVRLSAMDTAFKPLDALFDRRIKLGALKVQGLVVEIPTALIESSAPVDPSTIPSRVPPRSKSGPGEGAAPAKVPPAKTAGSPTDALYALGQLDWRIDIDSIELDGELRDAAGGRYAMDLRSGAIRPGEESSIEASLKLSAGEVQHAGLKEFNAKARIFLKQKTLGGFEQVRLDSTLDALDQAGNQLVRLSQELELTVQGFEERASLRVKFDADLPRPGVFLPELSVIGELVVAGHLALAAEGELLTLSQADFRLSAAGVERLSLRANKEFTLGGAQDLSGNLIDLRLSQLPLAWLAPWLPEGLLLTGEDFSAAFKLTGLAGGAFELSSSEPLRLGPLSLVQDGAPLLEQITIQAQPVLRLAADKSLSWDLGALQIADRYGKILAGSSTGRFDPSLTAEGFFPAGLETQTQLDIGLQEITQQPALAGYTSIMSGRAAIQLKLAPSQAQPLQVQGQLSGLSPRGYPGQRQDYRFALQLNEPKSGLLGLGATLRIGSENQPSSDLQFAGELRPSSAPLEFKADLTAPRLSQADLEFLAAAFQAAPPPAADDTFVVAPPRPAPSGTGTGAGSPAQAAEPVGPPWAGYAGEISVSIKELVLTAGEVLSELTAQASVTEPLLRLQKLSAKLYAAEIAGSGELSYSSRQRMAYALRSDLSFAKMDPAAFAKEPGASFPVKGIFEGRAQFSGQGETLEQALDAIEGEVLVTGREGVLTAFELDARSNLGLLGAGILGQSLNRPGISAMAKTVPYFENMPFSDFTLRLQRQSDQRILIPELRFIGRNVLIDGSGSIAASSLKDAMNQPLDLKLELGAKGQLVDYLETLKLLGPNTGADGFRRWEQALQIRGSLSDPDTSALERILKEAANRALTRSGRETEAPVTQDGETSTEQNLQPKPSKEERIIRDVEAGLNLLFGK